MKDGDEVYCIKDIIKWDGSYIIQSGKTYKIIYRDKDEFEIRTEYPVWMGGNETFYLKKRNDVWPDCKILSDYFISTKKYRKLKLEKIDAESRR